VFRQNLLAVGVDLDLPDHGHAGAFQAEIEAADTGEQGEHVHGSSTPVRSSGHFRSRSSRTSRAESTDSTSRACRDGPAVGQWHSGQNGGTAPIPIPVVRMDRLLIRTAWDTAPRTW
jgi:hypothetical protein